MLILGLTGSIATGKSTVSAFLCSAPYNLPLLDADVLARQVVEPGTPGHASIVRHFQASTPGLLLPSGALDRAVLGKRVFGASPERVADRAVLNRIIHPLVRRALYAGVVRAYLAGHWAVVLDVPLLFEAGLEALCGVVVVVTVNEETQMRRLLARDSGLSEEDAKRRVGSQMSVQEKVRVAEAVFGQDAWVVRNDGDFTQLGSEVERTVAKIRRGRDGWWCGLWGFPPVALVLGLSIVVRNWWRRREWEKKRKAGEKEKAKL